MQNVAEAEAKNARLTNMNTRATFICRVGERWLTFRLEGIGNVIVLLAGLLGVASKGEQYSGFVGAKQYCMPDLSLGCLTQADLLWPAGMALVYGRRTGIWPCPCGQAKFIVCTPIPGSTLCCPTAGQPVSPPLHFLPLPTGGKPNSCLTRHRRCAAAFAARFSSLVATISCAPSVWVSNACSIGR